VAVAGRCNIVDEPVLGRGSGGAYPTLWIHKFSDSGDSMSTLIFSAAFTQNTGDPATGLALADIDLYLTAVNKSTGVDTVVWDGTQNPTEEIDNIGAYLRRYTSADFDTYIYYGRATYTGATVLDSDSVTGECEGVTSFLDTIIDRIGAFTGTGVNTILGFLRAIASAAATLPSDIGGTFTPVTDSLEAIRDALRSSPAVASLSDVDISNIVRGDTYTESDRLSGLGNISARNKLWLSIKDEYDDADTASIVQVEETAGLVYLNGAAATNSAWGSLTVTDAAAGDVTFTLAANATRLLRYRGFIYDIQMLAGSAVTTLQSGNVLVTGDVTRAIS